MSRWRRTTGRGPLKSLEHVLPKVQKSKFDKAVVHQTFGVIYANQADYPLALKHFKASLDDDALPVPTSQSIRYNVAQLYMMEDDYQAGVDTLLKWMEVIESDPKSKQKISAQAWLMLANGYSRLKQHEKVIDPARKAIALTDKPKENWYLLLLASHYELKQLPDAIGVLEELVILYPEKKKYWLQLSSMNMEHKQDAKALAALRAAYKHGVLDEEKDYLRLANFLTFREIPYKAGVVYRDGLKQGIVEPTQENFRRLANFWSHAKESDKAIDAFYKALQLEADPELQVKLARLLIQKERFSDVVELLEAPAEGAEDKQVGEMALLTGMAHYQLERPGMALEMMQKAIKYKNTRGQASSWVNYLKEELKSKG